MTLLRSSLLGLLAVPWATAPLAGARGGADNSPGLPFVINTWGGAFTAATEAAFAVLLEEGAAGAAGPGAAGAGAALDAAEAGCAACEARQCDGTVGFGGSPDEACETTLDALVMDGATLAAGAVAGLRRVPHAVAVARRVLRHTRHTLLAGDLATAFAAAHGFAERDLATPASAAACAAWRRAACQPNYRRRVVPDPAAACGPYAPLPDGDEDDDDSASSTSDSASSTSDSASFSPHQASHDTIAMVTIDAAGAMAAATSTNGAAHKVPGRVGDGPIVGSGAYVDGEVGGCGATGDGDIMMRFLPCYQAVENLRRGMTPREAAEDAVRRMLRRYPNIASGLVVVDRQGRHAGAASGWTFTYAYRGGSMRETEVVTIAPLDPEDTGVPSEMR